MEPIPLNCPHCGVPLQLLIAALPARVQCPHCRTGFTLNPRRTAVSPPTGAATAGLQPPGAAPGVFLRGTVALALLALLLGVGIALARYCFNGDTPAEASPPPPLAALAAVPPSAAAVDPAVERQRRRTTEAIERGVGYLKSRLASDRFKTAYSFYPGGDTGAAALAGLTLLECGVAPTDPAILKVASRVRAEGPKLRRTYCLALAVLFLDRLQDPAAGELIRDLALHLIAGQTTGGGWGYDCPALAPDERRELLAALRGEGPAPQTATPKAAFETNSNTQFAILALWVALAHGVPAEPALARVGARFRSLQNADGSWGYAAGNQATTMRDSMTCAGLLGVAVARSLEPPARGQLAPRPGGQGPGERAQDPAIERGLRYLAGSLARLSPVADPEKAKRLRQAAELVELMTRGPNFKPEERKAVVEKIRGQLQWRGALVGSESMGDLYFLWSVERVAVLYDLKTVGGLDWYAWGAELLLNNQKADGSWRERFPGLPDTCFALLFLRRANLIKDVTQRLHARLGLPAELGARNPPPSRKTP